jgi:ribose transport system substrate-binding protein
MKKLMQVVLVAALSLAATAIEAKAKSLDGVKVGMTVQDLSNPTWAGYCQAIQKKIKEEGGSMNFVACESNVSKQIAQIENFVASGVDVLIVQPACKQAREQGVKVLAWDDPLENADVAWLVDNHALGYMIGEHAAKWINEKLGGTAEVAILNYPQLPILLERGNGIKEAITEKAPDAKIVAETSAINPQEGISKMETIFQSHPNVKVIACIGGGGSIGANEAAKAAGKITEDFGIFAADATQPELAAMKNNEGVRMSVKNTGTNDMLAAAIAEVVGKLVSGEPMEEEEIFTKLIPVTPENVDEYYGK